MWNEPWGPTFFYHAIDDAAKDEAGRYRRGDHPAADYVELVRRARDAVHAVDPTIPVLGFNGSAGQTDWTRQVAGAGGLAACDAISYHHYANDSRSELADAIERGWNEAIGPLVVDGKPPRPVWMSEGSSLGGVIGNGLYRHTMPSDENCLATSDRLARTLVALLARGVEHEFLYSMHTASGFGASNPWRSLVCEDGSPHPCAAAHAALAWLLEDTKPAGALTCAPGVDALLFSDGKRTIAALLPRAWHAPYVLPRAPDTNVSDVMGNPLPADAALGDTVAYIERPIDAAAMRAWLAKP